MSAKIEQSDAYARCYNRRLRVQPLRLAFSGLFLRLIRDDVSHGLARDGAHVMDITCCNSTGEVNHLAGGMLRHLAAFAPA
jgi:hypothetical protein